jgi:hypothetical protein
MTLPASVSTQGGLVFRTIDGAEKRGRLVNPQGAYTTR